MQTLSLSKKQDVWKLSRNKKSEDIVPESV